MSTYLRWRQLTPATTPTNGRGGHNAVAVTDTVHGYALVAGGSSCGSPYNDASRWDGTNWTNLGTPAPFSVGERDALAYCFDVNTSKVVFFGGGQVSSGDCSTPLCDARYYCLSGDTVTYDGTTWSLLAPAHAPSPRWLAVMGYCPAISKPVLFGGFNLGNSCAGCGTTPGCVQPISSRFTDTWAWDGTDWTQLFPAHSPYDLESATTMGGFLYAWGRQSGATSMNTLWKFDGTDWTVVSTAAAPSARNFAGFAYWPALGKIILHGGRSSGGGYLNDTWSFDGTNWTLETTCASPTRISQALTPDPVDGSLLGVGGDDGSCFVTIAKQTWKLEQVTAPDVTTGSGSGTCSTAAVAGTVNPHGTATDVYVDYGPTTSYGTSQLIASGISGTSPVAVSGSLSALSPGVTYHFRITAVTACASASGADASFTEGACPGANAYLHGYVELGAP